jgi:Tol biopolymer transport system component
MTWNWAARIGEIAAAAVLLGGSHGYGVRDVVFAAEEGGPAAPQVRARARSESLTLVDTIDFSKWRPDTFAVSPDGMRMAYASLEESGRGHMVIDGKAGKGYAGLAGKPAFSPDSRRMAYIAMNTQNQWVVAVDDGENPDKHPSVKGHAGVSPELCFSPDGRRLAYVVVAESGGAVKQAVVVDHQEGAKYDAVDGLVFSPNGQRLAYAAKTGNRWAVVVDGREGRRHDSVFTGTPVFSPDGRHLAYGGREGNRSFVVVDRKRGRDYDDLGGMVRFSPDSTKVVYSPNVGKRRAVVVNGDELGLYERVDDSSFVFSANSKRLAYKAGDANSWFVVVDGKRGRTYAGVGRPVFTPDGRRVAHSACERCGGGAGNTPAMFVVVDGERIGAEYTDIDDRIEFSADGSRMAFAAKRGTAQFVVVDKKEEKAYAGVMSESLEFSPSGRDLVYVAANHAGSGFVVVSGVEGKEFDAVGLRGFEGSLLQGGRVLFEDDRSFRYLACERERVYLVRNTTRGR